MTHEYLDILAARRPDDADVQEVVAACRKLLDAHRAWFDGQLADQASARAAGLTHENVRLAVGEYLDGDISFGRLVELVRTAAKVLAEQERK
jgi:hypothetical protein